MKISVNFEGGEITGNAGLLLFEEFSEKLGIKKLLNKYLPDLRKGNFEHTKPENIGRK